MNNFTLINLEWNCYNGFIFKFLHLELYKPIDIDNSLFSINFTGDFLYIDILFKTFKIFDKTFKENDK